MPKTERRWVRVKALTADEKAEIAARCQRFIDEVLRPLVLPEIRPTEFNYLVDLSGKWRGSKYSFIARYRSDNPDRTADEFETAFARLDHDEMNYEETRFDIMWHRHTGQWWRLHVSKSLEEALRLVETTPLLHP